MKKSLPTQSGFTLVELLVVITILAILGTIGLAVFSGAQKSARDGKRVEDIRSIAKSLETSADYTDASGVKTYSNAILTDFPKGVPADPSSSGNYCIMVASTTVGSTLPEPAVDGPWSACPTIIPVGTRTGFNKVDVNTPFTFSNPAPVKSWKVCTWKESGAFYCENSIQ